GHALILWDAGRGYSLEQTDKHYPQIEQLLTSLDLRVADSKKLKPRPARVFANGVAKVVLYQVEGLCTYIARNEFELSFERDDVLNVITEDGGYLIGEFEGRTGAFPRGLTKRVAGSELPEHELQAALAALASESPAALVGSGGATTTLGGFASPPPPGSPSV